MFYFLGDYCGEYIIADTNISSNLQKIEHNQLVLLRDHVYGVQSFQPDKDRLWREINAGLLVTKCKNQIANNQYIAGARSLIRAIRYSIGGSLKFVFLKAFKKSRLSVQRYE